MGSYGKYQGNHKHPLPQGLIDQFRNGEISESQIYHMPSLSNDMAPSHLSMREQTVFLAQNIQPRMKILSAAHVQFEVMCQLKRTSNLESERHYQALYKDICEHKDLWFDYIFRLETREPMHCERCTGMLGTLCTILRQRGDFEECIKVMELYTEVLQRYEQMTARRGVHPDQVVCCKGLAYKYNLIRINLGVQTNQRDWLIDSFRKAVAYELEPNFPFEESWGWIPPVFDLPKDPKRLSDDEIYRCVMKIDEMNKEMLGGDKYPRAALRVCGYCKKTEEMLGDYNFCGRCHKVPYCSKECQKRDWKAHKVFCGKKKTETGCNVPPQDMQSFAKLLCDNFARTVHDHSKKKKRKKVTQQQKKAAEPALLKLLRNLLVTKFTHFNSQIGLTDACRDLAFNRELQMYFEQQPGYESLKEIHAKPEVRKYLEEYTSLKLPRVEDDLLDDAAGLLLGNFCIAVGLDTVPKEQRDAIRPELVKLMKKFMLKNPKFNSHEGVRTRLPQCEDFQMESLAIFQTAISDE